MSRSGKVLYNGKPCGRIIESDDGYRFSYDKAWLAEPDAMAVSLTLPLSPVPYSSKTLFPFFDGLIPEGWLLEIAVDNWKLNPRDRMGLLLSVCRDCVGAVSIEADNLEDGEGNEA